MAKNKNKKKRKERQKKSHDKEDSLQEPNDDQNDQGDEEPAAKLSLYEDDSGSTTTKRQHDDEDSDVEDKPKKKKKKQPIATETSDKKGKPSIRQMKREKHAQRQAEAQATAKDQLKGQCLNYLSQWKHNKQNWKFMKAKQVWLYKNKFSTHLVPDSSWPLLLEYFESAQGNIRNMLLSDANKIIQQMDEWTESQNDHTENKDKEEENNEESDATLKPKKPDDHVYKRARDLIQCLEE